MLGGAGVPGIARSRGRIPGRRVSLAEAQSPVRAVGTLMKGTQVLLETPSSPEADVTDEKMPFM